MYVTHAVILPRITRTKPEGCQGIKILLFHCEVGGVTDGTWIRHVYCSHQTLSLTVQQQAARDAGTVLNAMEGGGHPCKAPPNISPAPSSRPILSIVREGVYHGRSLLPWRIPAPRVVTTNVFSPTLWVCRKISVEERLYSRDVTKFMLKDMNPISSF